MDKNSAGSSLSTALESMIVGFIVAGAATAVLFTNFSGQGRLWDRLTGHQDEFGASPVAGAVRVTAPDPGGSHILVAAVDPGPESEVPVPKAAAPAPAAKPAPVKVSWIKHLTTRLEDVAISGPASQHSSASASAADAPAAPAAAPDASASVASARTPVPAAPAASPSYVNYGGNTRSDIMSSASGPVYNFKGRKK